MTDTEFDGGMGMSRRGETLSKDVVSEPERDVEALTETLESVEEGDIVKVGLGVRHVETGRTGGTSVMKTFGVERNAGGFDRRVSLLHHDGDVFRLYMTGIGNEDMDPWEIVSCPYDPEMGVAYMTDFVSHGWVVGAEVVEDEQ